MLMRCRLFWAAVPDNRHMPSPKRFRIPWLLLLNFVFLQWLTLRLAKTVERSSPDVVLRWTVMSGIVPLTGWWGHYVRLWGRGESASRPDVKDETATAAELNAAAMAVFADKAQLVDDILEWLGWPGPRIAPNRAFDELAKLANRRQRWRERAEAAIEELHQLRDVQHQLRDVREQRDHYMSIVFQLDEQLRTLAMRMEVSSSGLLAEQIVPRLLEHVCKQGVDPRIVDALELCARQIAMAEAVDLDDDLKESLDALVQLGLIQPGTTDRDSYAVPAEFRSRLLELFGHASSVPGG